MIRTIFLLSLLIASWSGSVSAATYSFQGANFSNFSSGSSFNSSMRVTGSFDINGFLSPNLANQDISGDIVTFSFSNGLVTRTPANTAVCIFRVTTDGNGNLLDVLISLRANPAPTVGQPLEFLDIGAFDYVYTGTGPSSGPGNECSALTPNNWATAPRTGSQWTSPERLVSVPALSDAGLIVASLLMALAGVITLRKRIA